MAGRTGIFKGDDPFVITRRWLQEAGATEPSDPNAVALATVDADGAPNVRIVLVKDILDDALVFFTNYASKKGQEIEASGKVALDFHWKSLERQIRVRGTVEREDKTRSDTYYRSRDLGSRIGAWASYQSQPLESKTELLKAVAKAELRHGMNPERPEFWGGFRVVPFEFEFWAAGKFRLHDRFRWTRVKETAEWEIQRLFP